jgi:transposase-like protein
MASRKNDMARVASLRYWQAEDARVVVEAWKESGERLTAFARRHGIRPRRLSQWATRLEASSEEISFHPVRVAQASSEERAQRDPIEIVMREGWTVRVPPGFHIEDLERVLSLLSVLEGSAGC